MTGLKILGIESSCDDTAVAIVNSAGAILANLVISQNQEHQVFQGVVPEIAARSHLTNIEKATRKALEKADLTISDIDVIAATCGPGLIGGVIVGAMFAKGLASSLGKDFIAVNHLEGHILIARLTDRIDYPYLTFLASGGHTQFVAVLGLGRYKILGHTLDDAIGEAFDKVAKMLGLDFPGGPEIEKRARLGNKNRFAFPRPLINSTDCNMSFSGLKTAVRLKIQEMQAINPLPDQNIWQNICDISASFQQAIIDVIIRKARIAIVEYEKLINLVLSNSNYDIMADSRSEYNKYTSSYNSSNIVSSVGFEARSKERVLYTIGERRSDAVLKFKWADYNGSLVAAGGVGANMAIRAALQELANEHGYRFVAPEPKLCTDNGVMIAFAGLERFKNGLINDVGFKTRARWSLEDI